MCFEVYMCPGSSVLVLIPLKICVALLRIVSLFPRDINARRLKVVMVEGFPSFGTKAFVICCVTTEDSNTPSLAVELVQMCRCQYFTTGFATESSMTSQSKTRNDLHLLLCKLAKVGSSKSSTNDFLRVSPNSSVTDVTKTPHS